MTKTLIEYENGGRIEVYPQVDTSASDYKNILACCDYFAKQGAKTVITPHFSETVGNPIYHIIYASLEGTKFWGRCPDFNVGGLWYEHEGYDVNKDLTDRKKRADTFSEMITRGVRQSDRIIVEDCGVGRRWAKKTVYSRVHFEKQNIKEVYIRTSDGLECLYKKEAG
jgi:hypothetical protein